MYTLGTTKLARTGKILNERQGPTFPRVKGRTPSSDNLTSLIQSLMPLSIMKAVFIMNSEIFLKGGDFMENYDPARQAAIREQMIRADLESGIPTVTLDEGQVDPSQGVVEVGSNPMTHPLRKGIIRTRFDSAMEGVRIVEDRITGQSVEDWSHFNSMREMDSVSDRPGEEDR